MTASLLLALLASITYGVSDFCGGTASRRAAALPVLLVSSPAGLVVLTGGALLAGGRISAAALLWGALAGVAGGGGVALLYRGLASSPMSVVAPLTAVMSAVVPVIAGVGMGERPGQLAYLGVLLAVGAVALVSRGADADVTEGAARAGRTAGIMLALLAGTGFGLFFVLIKGAPAGAGLWPLVAARATAWGSVAVAAVCARELRWPGRAALGLTVTAGVLDGAANACYLFAVRGGLLSLVSVVVALYPASTVLLARFVHAERLVKAQLAGLALAGVAMALLALPT